jgi:membrane-bound serine protease (ClpP class)
MVGLGIALLVISAVLVVVEAHVPTHGVLGAAAVGAFVAGSVSLVAAAGGGLALGLAIGVVLGAAGLAGLVLAMRSMVTARHGRARTGTEAVAGHIGVVRAAGEGEASVFVDGALWRARPFELDDGDDGLRAGDRVVVEGVHGLTLAVRKAHEWELMP